jgi:hypothetical protein
VRALTATGDFSFGIGRKNYFVDSPAGVAQLVRTALLLFQGEWFLDTQAGTPWLQEIIGKSTQYDVIIKAQVLSVPGVLEIISYSSTLDSNRFLSISMTLNTQFGVAQLAIQLTTAGGYGVGGYGSGGFGQ